MKSLFAILILVGLLSCNQAEKKSVSQKDSTNKDAVNNNAVVLKDSKLAAIYSSYIALKDELVKSDSTSVSEKALALSQNLAGFEGCESTVATAKMLSVAHSLKAQRKDFTAISSDLVALFKHADVAKGTIYVQHCPMANKGDGGDWLSSNKDIQNPYYGDEMLNCGSVTEEIKSK
ncbi:DUF3347 domain-containing protein [Pedobacter changchengzhani]|uniref:DUF3347 domain-containing protein n=1 Tax=Pedobacter changchengzhani TaxID=2529274 RepID=A0A4V3A053_9SPHI|nr:DUF3347 domain-containing protein [Pedobacter changchengzhani]TDG36103.1 DUF3347 domain-containing protein [Pedobacter changchengzhani]